MTIQLELDFLTSYAFDACLDLHIFATSISNSNSFLKNNYIFRLKELQRQATDLRNHAFLHDYINWEEYEFLSDSIFASSDLFWS